MATALTGIIAGATTGSKEIINDTTEMDYVENGYDPSKYSLKSTIITGDLHSLMSKTTTGDLKPTTGGLHSLKSTTTTGDLQATKGDKHSLCQGPMCS
jgi:hypothetical protein